MKIRTITMETLARRSSLFLRESWPVLEKIKEIRLLIDLKIQQRILPPNNNKIICQLAVNCFVQTKQKDQGKNDDKDKMTPENVDLKLYNAHVVSKSSKSVAYVNKGRVVSPLCPDQTTAVLAVEVITTIIRVSSVRRNADDLY